jgi:Leucine-rich repeat (LRR) protein
MKLTVLFSLFSVAVLFAACGEKEKAASELIVRPATIEAGSGKSVYPVYVTSNTIWSSTSSGDWCASLTLNSFGSDSTKIEISENTSFAERVAYVSFTNSEKTIVETVKIIQQGIPTRVLDSTALVEFYNAMNGDGWHNKTGWKTSSLEGWHGVSFKNGRISALKMENNNLSGNLSALLKNLPLDTLSIVSEPGVTGYFAFDSSQFANLKYLNLSGTSLSGPVPSELGKLPNLKELILVSNQRLDKTVPRELANLPELESLRLENLHVHQDVFEKLAKLERLTLKHDSIIADHPLFENVTTLKHLSMDSCKFPSRTYRVFPDAIYEMTNLESLSLAGNMLSGEFSDEIPLPGKLTYMRLSDNRFVGEIPRKWASSNLEELWVDRNLFYGYIDPKLRWIETFEYCPQSGPPFDNFPCL